MDSMPPLAQFRFDEQISASEVYLFDDDLGELVPMGHGLAMDIAHSRGSNLVAWWPDPDGEETEPSCIVAKVAEPIRWEQIPTDSPFPDIDEHLWFAASCGGRDFLLDGNGHTYPGRMTAWCPAKETAYNVSLSEMGEMSEQTRYFVRGFLSGDSPAPPEDADGYIDPADLNAWQAATRRFRETGLWHGRWGTCATCGCVLLPDTAAERCHEHSDL